MFSVRHGEKNLINDGRYKTMNIFDIPCIKFNLSDEKFYFSYSLGEKYSFRNIDSFFSDP